MIGKRDRRDVSTNLHSVRNLEPLTVNLEPAFPPPHYSLREKSF